MIRIYAFARLSDWEKLLLKIAKETNDTARIKVLIVA